MKANYIYIFLFVAALSAAVMRFGDCHAQQGPGGDCHVQQRPGNDSITITPAKLFPGDLAKIAPHLGFDSYGAETVTFEGDRSVGYGLEIWKNGKPSPVDYAIQDPRRSGELTFTALRVKKDNGKEYYKIVLVYEGSRFTTWQEMPGLEMDYSKAWALKHETKVKLDSPTSVWIIGGGKKPSGGAPDESIDSFARRVEWAIVLKVKISKSEI